MKVALACVVALGAGIGLLLPAGTSTAPPAAAAAAATVAANAPGPVAADAPAQGWSAETRLARAESGHFHADAMINGTKVNVVVDTGATTVALTVADARRIGIPFSPEAFEVVGSGASGPVRGQEVMIDRISVDGKEVTTVRGAVLEGLEVSLLGQAYLSRISGVEMRGDEMILR